MCKRSHKADELDTDMPASHLLKIIAKRAKRTDGFNIHNLKPNEAFLGDYQEYGMSRRQYRTAKDKLEKWGFATFKTTSKGTVATLVDTSIYDINSESIGQQNDTQEANKRPTIGQRQATNNNDKNVNNEKNDKNKYMDFVYLSKEEYEKLKTSFGEPLLKEKISALNDYIGSKGIRYKSHYHTILNWNRRDSKPVAGRKLQLLPIVGKTCSTKDCKLPGVYKRKDCNFDTYCCLNHLPKEVKEVYG